MKNLEIDNKERLFLLKLVNKQHHLSGVEHTSVNKLTIIASLRSKLKKEKTNEAN